MQTQVGIKADGDCADSVAEWKATHEQRRFTEETKKSEIVPLFLWVFTSLLNNDFFFFKERVNHAVHLLYIYWFSSCRNDFVWAGSVSVTDPRVFLLIDLHRFMNTRLVPFHIFSWSVIISIETFNKDVIVFSSLCNFLFVKHQK